MKSSRPAWKTTFRLPEPADRRRILAGACAGLVLQAILGFLLLGGPGFPFAAKLALDHLGRTQGFVVTCEIRGSLFHGVILDDVVLSRRPGDPAFPLAGLAAERVSVTYRFSELIRDPLGLGWLESVRLQTAEIAVEIPAVEPDSAPRTDPPPLSIPRDRRGFTCLWNVLQARIDLSDIELVIRQGDRENRLSGLNFRLSPGKNGSLRCDQLHLAGAASLSSVEIPLAREERSLALQTRLPDLGIESFQLALAEPEPGRFDAEARISAGGGLLRLSLNEDGSIHGRLEEGTSLDLGLLHPALTGPARFGGMIEECDVRFAGALSAPPSWQIEGEIAARGFAYADLRLDQLVLGFAGNRIRCRATLPGMETRLEAAFPFAEAAEPAALAELPISLAGTCEVTSLERVCRHFASDIPIAGTLRAELAAAEFVPSLSRFLRGQLSLETGELTFAGAPLPAPKLTAELTGEDRIQIRATADSGGGTRLDLTGSLDQSSLNYQGSVEGSVRGEDALDRIRAATASPHRVGGIASLTWRGTGNITASRHSGDATIGLERFRYREGRPIDGELGLDYAEADFHLKSLALRSGPSRISGRGSWRDGRLSIDDFSLTRDGKKRLHLRVETPLVSGGGSLWQQSGPIVGEMTVTDLDVEDLTSLYTIDPPLRGTLHGAVGVRGTWRQLQAEAKLNLDSDASGPSTRIDLRYFGNPLVPHSWEGQFDARVAGLRLREAEIEDFLLHAAAVSSGDRKQFIADLRWDQAGSELRAEATCDVTDAGSVAELSRIPFHADGAIQVPDIAALLGDLLPRLAGEGILRGNIGADLEGVRFSGKEITAGGISVQSDNFSLAGEGFEVLSLRGKVEEPDRIAFALDASLDESNAVRAGGVFDLKGHDYRAEVEVTADRSAGGKLERMIAGRTIERLLPAKTRLDWSGSGSLRQETHRGSIDFAATRLTLADGAEPIDVSLKGDYTEVSAEFPGLTVESAPVSLTADLSWRDSFLSLDRIRGSGEGVEFLSGHARLPLDRSRLDRAGFFGQDSPVDCHLVIERAPLASLLGLFTANPPLEATVDAVVRASGSAFRPLLSASLSADGIRALREQESGWAVGQLRLALDTTGDRATLDGSFAHPDIKPLEIRGDFPFHPGAWATGDRDIGGEPLRVEAFMERSPLSFLATQIPGIERIEGVIGLDLAVSGTVSRPELRGSGLIDLDQLDFVDRNAPDISQLDTVVSFSDNQIRLDRLYAIVAGGIVEGGGSASLQRGSEPMLDFSLRGTDVLVSRTHDLNLRTDADLSIRGPLSRASLTGELGITNSRFFKNFDLLPVTPPTLRRSRIPTAEKKARGMSPLELDFGIPIEPFASWTSDVRIHTKTPFLARGNLARASASADIRITGPLSRPVPRGFVSVDEGRLTPPFSEINIEVGRVEFDERTGFNGAVEVKARAQAENHRITIYIHDQLLNPKFVFTSIPPLPAEDIMTLLATGTVRSDLTSEGVTELAASRAVSLFLKNLRKTSAAADRPPTLFDQLQERTELELGRTNPRTGTQTFGGKIRLWKQLFFVSDVDRENDYRALLKYVFKFD